MANGIDSAILYPTPVGIYNLGEVMDALPAGRKIGEIVSTQSGHDLMLVKSGGTITDGALVKWGTTAGDVTAGIVIETAAAYDTVLGFNPAKGASVASGKYFWIVVGPTGAPVADVKSADGITANQAACAGGTAGTLAVIGTPGTTTLALTASVGMTFIAQATSASSKLQGRIQHSGN